jgi:hypothetical protein
VRQRWSAQAAEMRANLVGDEDGWARGRRIEAVGTNVREAGGCGTTSCRQPGPARARSSAQVRRHDARRLRRCRRTSRTSSAARRKRAALNYGHGLIEKDPAAAGSHDCRAASLDQWITPEQNKALVNEAQTNVRIADADARRHQAQVKQQVREDVTEFKQRSTAASCRATKEFAQLTVGRAQALGLPELVDDIGY